MSKFRSKGTRTRKRPEPKHTRTRKRQTPKLAKPEQAALALEAEEAPVVNVGLHIEPPSASLSLLVEDVIDLAFHGGDAEPLAACIEGGSVSQRKAVADWFRKSFQGNLTAMKEVRNRRIIELYKEGWHVEQIAKKFDLTARMIFHVLKDYNNGTFTITPPTAGNQ
jgi:hypothetical protein